MLNRSFAGRLCTYTGERFPISQYGIAISVFYFSAYLVTQAVNGERIRVEWNAAAGLTTILLVFFHLRVMDELKDAGVDAQYHPERPVPRGLVSPAELKILGLAVISLQVGLNLWLALPAFAAYLSMLIYTLLMYREFFCGHWLRRHFLLYTISHMISVPLMAIYVYAVYAFRNNIGLHPTFGIYLALSFIVGLLLEMSRKIRSPVEELEGVDSYSRYFGTDRVAYFAVWLMLLGSVAATGLAFILGINLYVSIAIWAVFAISATGFLRFRISPSPHSARRLERFSSPLYMMGTYMMMIIGIVAGSGTGMDFHLLPIWP